MSELKPCPFCGSKDISIEREYVPSLRKYTTYFGWCSKCDIYGPGAKTELNAVKKWNRRAIDINEVGRWKK